MKINICNKSNAMKKILLIIALMNILCLSIAAQTYDVFNSSNGFVDDYISSLYVDSNGALWIGTYNNGIYTYANDEFTHYDEDEYDLLTGRAKAFAEDSEGNLWIGFYHTSQGGVMMYDGNLFEATHTPSDSVSIGRVVDLDISSDDKLLVYESPNLYNYATLNIIKGDSIASYSFANTTSQIISEGDLVETVNGEIWLSAGWGGLYELVGDTVLLQEPPFGFTYEEEYMGVYSLLKAADGNVWITEGLSGIVVTNDDYSFWTSFFFEQNDQSYIGVLPGYLSYHICENKDEQIWFTSLDYYNVYLGGWSNMYLNTFHEGHLLTFDIFEDMEAKDYGLVASDHDQNVWVSTEVGLMRLSNIPLEIPVDTTTTTLPEDTLSTPIDSSTYVYSLVPNDIAIYPNPVDHTLYIEGRIEEYDLFNTKGELVDSGINLSAIPTKDLANGRYFLKLMTNDTYVLKNFIVQH